MSCCSPKKNNQEPSSCCASKEEKQQSQTSSCCANPQNPKRVDRQMTIKDILEMFPYKAQRLAHEITSAGLHCIGCHASVYETLEGGMFGHGKTEAQINELVDRLNALLDEKLDLSTISMTACAAEKFSEILAEEGKTGWGMRFAEELAGCSGFEYVLDFSEKAEEDDQIFLSHGIEIHVKKNQVLHLLGSEIDYVKGMRGAGFKISNPNSRSSCGCGNSHNYD